MRTQTRTIFNLCGAFQTLWSVLFFITSRSHFSCLSFHSAPLLSLPFYPMSLSIIFFLFHLSPSKFSCSIWVAVEIKGAPVNSWIEETNWRQIRGMKGKVKGLTGNWSRSKCLVLHYRLHSLFSLFLIFPSFLYYSPSLILSWPPEGSPLAQCENQSLTPSRPTYFHLVRFLECQVFSTFYLGGLFPSTLKQITYYLLKEKAAKEIKTSFIIAWWNTYKLTGV